MRNLGEKRIKTPKTDQKGISSIDAKTWIIASHRMEIKQSKIIQETLINSLNTIKFDADHWIMQLRRFRPLNRVKEAREALNQTKFILGHHIEESFELHDHIATVLVDHRGPGAL